jgi:hypothetical protein
VFPDRHAAHAEGLTQRRTGMEFTIGKMVEELATQLHARKGTTAVSGLYRRRHEVGRDGTGRH